MEIKPIRTNTNYCATPKKIETLNKLADFFRKSPLVGVKLNFTRSKDTGRAR